MMRSLLLSWAVFVLMAVYASAQSITVHVLEAKTQKPLKRIALDLRVDCFNPKRPKALQQMTDASGIAVFQGISIEHQPVCIDLFSIAYAYASHQLDYVFALPAQAERMRTTDKLLNPIVTNLPADITFEVQKRNLAKRLLFMFQGN